MTILIVELRHSVDSTYHTKLELDDSGFDGWKDLDPASSKLVQASGSVKTNPDDDWNGLRCVNALDLIDLNWESKKGQSGKAKRCEQCDSGCDPDQTWEVTERK